MTERTQEQHKLKQMNKKLQRAAAEEKLHRRRKRLITTVLAWAVGIVASLAVVSVVGVIVMVLSGGSKLSNRTRGASPSIVMDEADVPNDPQADEPAYVWKEGWIRYEGNIYEYNDNIMTFLVMGVDKMTTVKEAKDATDGGQADGLFLVVVNPDSKDVKLIAVNRDTMVDIYMYGFEENGVTPVTKAQITVQHGFGDGLEQSCEATVDAVSKLFYDLPISGYAAINMGAVQDIVEAVDGVDLKVLEDLTKVNPKWKEGVQVHLIGKDAYDYVHFRDTAVFESARGRLARQKQFLSVYIEKLKTKVREDITLPVQLYSTLSKYMVTDITADQAAYLAAQMRDYSFETGSIYTMEGTTIMGQTYEEFYPDYDELKDLMIRIFYREVDPEEAGS